MRAFLGLLTALVRIHSEPSTLLNFTKWFLGCIGEDNATELFRKSCDWLHGLCKVNDLFALETAVKLHKVNGKLLSNQIRAVYRDGHTLLTLVCSKPDADAKLVETVIELGFPDNLLSHQVEGKNALEWSRKFKNTHVEKILLQKFKAEAFERKSVGGNERQGKK